VTPTTTQRLSGVLPVLQTPFDEDGLIDFHAVLKEIDWVFGQGVDGVVVGMVSEVLRLSSEERDDLGRAVVKATAGRGPVVLSVGAESTSVAVRHVKAASDCGAQAVMATPPVTVDPSNDDLVRYFAALVAASPLPVIIQDASSYVGRPIGIDLLGRLWAEFGKRVMFKPEALPVGPRVSALRELSGGQASVFEGTGGLYLVETFGRGVAGTMPAADVCWAIVALWRALCDGRIEDGYRIAGPLSLLVAMQQSSLDAYVATEKELLVHQGVLPSSRMRGPSALLPDEKAIAEVLRLVDGLKDAVEASKASARAGLKYP
jgi:dihydrodipicolinate synthase/N-acetylneuraminate lyase